MAEAAPAPSDGQSPPNARGASNFLAPPKGYMSVKEAIMEQAEMRRTHRMNMPATVRLPPAWGEVHAKAAQQQSLSQLQRWVWVAASGARSSSRSR